MTNRDRITDINYVIDEYLLLYCYIGILFKL